MHYLRLLLDWGSTALTPMLLILLIRRKQHRKFSFFVAYAAFCIIAEIIRNLGDGNMNRYFFIYWSTEAIYATLALLVIRQIFHRVLEVEYRLFRWMRFLLPVTLVLIFIFSFYESIQALDKVQKIIAAINGFDISVHAFEAALLFLVLALRFLFPARWLRYEFGILTGYALSSIVTISTDLIWLKYGKRYDWLYTNGPVIAFMITELIWIWTFSAPPKAIEEITPGPEEPHIPMDRQQYTFLRLQEWLRQNRPFSSPR